MSILNNYIDSVFLEYSVFEVAVKVIENELGLLDDSFKETLAEWHEEFWQKNVVKSVKMG